MAVAEAERRIYLYLILGLVLAVIEYINLLKCHQAQKFIRSGMNVSEAATELGFENLSYFTRTYKKYLNRLPSDDLKNKE